ncbi:Fic family protein [Thauera sinica]|uniref:Fic family protein n=1 Tax=Thauera sinica TaxID=2665146 RepID=A0ABW1AQ20_9RHOO|nr:Fic family protein [Thauera sp. K11]
MSLTERQQKIIDVFLESPDQTRSVGDFTDFGLDRTTIFRDIKKLVQAGLLQAEGKVYRLDKDSDAYLRWDLSRAPHHREPVRYNPKLLGDYKPNSTFLLTDAQLLELEKAGKVEGIAQAREKGKLYERVLASLLIDLTHASSNLENVNISWLDTKTLIEFGERPEGLTEQQMQIVLNHKKAITFLKDHGPALSLAKRDLLDIHALLIEGLLGDASAIGALRSVVVRFDDSKYLPPDNPHQLNEIFEAFCEKANVIANPYEQAFFAMVFIPYIQPFQDGNKRTSRIAMNIPLVKNALAPFSFSDIRGRDYTFGLLAFYERNQHRFLANAFTTAYKKSAARYGDLVSHINDGGLLGTIST